MRLKITELVPIEGPLYMVNGEDGPLYVFDTVIAARADNGFLYDSARPELVIRGYGTYEDNNHPNYNYKNEVAAAIVQYAPLIQEINTEEWTRIEFPSLEERLATEAEIEQQQRYGC